MGIFDRVSRVISSNVNSLLDKADDPKKNVELLVEDMREAIVEARKEVLSSMASEKQLEKKVADLDAEAEKWTRRAELALKAEDESLAREALVQKKRVVGDRDHAEALLAEAKATSERLRADQKRMERKIAEVEASKGTIAANVQMARSGAGAEGLGARGGTSAFDEFRRMEGDIDRAEAEGQAAREVNDALDPGAAAGGLSREQVEAKFAALEGSGKRSEIDDELAAMKKRVRVK